MTYFRVEAITPLAQVSPGAHIHVVGVCGVAMAQLAILLTEKGFAVSGSDKEFYEPMGSRLKASRVTLFEGYRADHVPPQTALAVIGNAVTASNEEVAEIERRKIGYTIFPKLLHEVVIGTKRSVVVSGTHGKTTTTALIAYVLEQLGMAPSYFIGGVAKDLSHSLKLGKGVVSVVEGDEYDSAFFAKVPKFQFYAPHFLIVTSIEFDHADIYPDLASINSQFDALVRGLPPASVVIACPDTDNMRTRVKNWETGSTPIITYGAWPQAHYALRATEVKDGTQRMRASFQGQEFQFELRITGNYNAINALAGIIVAKELGASLTDTANALRSFQGVKRRQEVRATGKIELLEDFDRVPWPC